MSVQRVIDVAEKYIGVKESPRGSNNVVFNTAYYGRPVSGDAYSWCCVFMWYVFREAGLEMLFFAGGKTASCTALMEHAKKCGQFYTSGYKSGDLALFNWSGGKTVAQHVGLIVEAGKSGIVTVEGNTGTGSDSDGGEVMTRIRQARDIIGVYRPEYEEEDIMDIDTIRSGLTELTGTGGGHSRWAGDAIKRLTAAGVFKGDGNGNYGWGQLLTREAMAQILCNILDILTEGGGAGHGI